MRTEVEPKEWDSSGLENDYLRAWHRLNRI
jgi:hypothetical protein